MNFDLQTVVGFVAFVGAMVALWLHMKKADAKDSAPVDHAAVVSAAMDGASKVVAAAAPTADAAPAADASVPAPAAEAKVADK